MTLNRSSTERGEENYFWTNWAIRVILRRSHLRPVAKEMIIF